MLNKISIVSAAIASSANAQKDSDTWKQRSVYHIITDRFSQDPDTKEACADLSDYCGGTWKGIENNLKYIADMNFDAILISPVVENVDKGYHGYWA